MDERLFVVDQNALREEGRLLSEMIVKDARALFVVPDVAFEEMIRSPHWESIFRRSLALLARSSARARFSISLYEAIRAELASGRPLSRAELLPTDVNSFFGAVLRELAEGIDGPYVRELQTKAPEIRNEMLASHLNPETGRERMRVLADTWMEGENSKALIVRLRRMPPGSDRAAFRLAIAKMFGDQIFLHLANNDLSLSPEKSLRFLEEKPLMLRYLYGEVLDSLSWAKEGGIGQASARVVNARQFDMQHAVLATCFEGFLSNDKGAREMYEDLCCVIAMKDQTPNAATPS